MKNLNADERDCLDRLKAWLAKVERIQNMYEPRGRIPRSDHAEARELYAALKRGLEAESRDLTNTRRRPPLTQAETQWYQPTIVEAHLHLEAPTNSTPEKWFSSLYDAQFDFSHMISQLKAARGGSE